MRLCYSCLLFVLMLPLASCARSEQGETGQTAVSDQPTSPQVDPSITAEVKSIAEIEELIAQQSGKVVVVDLWALW